MGPTPLDWTGRQLFLQDLVKLLDPIPIQLSSNSRFMPHGYKSPKEARLETFGPKCIRNDAWRELRKWRLIHKEGVNTPKINRLAISLLAY